MKFISHIVRVFSMSGVLLFCGLIKLSPAQTPNQNKVDLKSELKWLPATSQTQKAVIKELQMKSGKVAAIPSYPKDALFPWIRERYEFETRDEASLKKQALMIQEDLLIAQQLLGHQQTSQKRRGLRLAALLLRRSNTLLKDPLLAVKILEGFVLPFINIGDKEGWKALSQEKLLWQANSAYGEAGQNEKRKQILRLLIQSIDYRNRADQTRIILSKLLASEQRYAEAISVLNSIETPGMSPAKSAIPELQVKADELAKKEKSQTAPQKSEGKTEPKESNQ